MNIKSKSDDDACFPSLVSSYNPAVNRANALILQALKIAGNYALMSAVENDIYIALGSNIGDRELNLFRAVAEIAKIPDSRVTALSSFYETEPVGMAAARHFLNAVLRVASSRTPGDLLNELMQIESEIFERSRGGGVDSRRMDLDILFYGNLCISMPPVLVIPHPRLHARRFVLEPLAEIAPEFMHPLRHKTVRELLGELQDCSLVIKT